MIVNPLRPRGGVLALACVLAASAPAQTFDSGSDGSDGALVIAGQLGTIRFDPASFDPPLDPDGDNVFHFTTISVGQNTTVRFFAQDFGGEGKPVYWLAQGDVVINGRLNLDGERGHANSGSPNPARAGAGGYDGGRGARAGQPAESGNGPGGSLAQNVTAGLSAGASHALEGGGDVTLRGRTYGNPLLLPLLGGSGAGGCMLSGNGSGGGSGGGAMLIASSSRITVSGSGSGITANGGFGGLSGFSAGGGEISSGGGSGGALRIVAPDVTFGSTSLLQANGGGGQTGSIGRIRVEGYRRTLPSNPLPSPTFGAPGLVFLPPTAPLLSATSVDGVAVAADPTGSFAMPDVVINSGQPVSIAIAATNVPVGTVVDVVLQAEGQSEVVVQSSPLAGTLANSTATASVTIPTGFARFFLRADW